MCNTACLEFGLLNLKGDEIQGKSVLEVGSLNVNGSLRSMVEKFSPKKYVGADICPGPGVDVICSADKLIQYFGSEGFDLVISTEVLEHIREWQLVISNLKRLLRPGGKMILTTRSKGFPFHAYPYDYWRFELKDLQEIFKDFIIEAIESDVKEPGVFIKVRKPTDFKEISLEKYELYSMYKNRQISHLSLFGLYFSKQWVISTAKEFVAKIFLKKRRQCK